MAEIAHFLPYNSCCAKQAQEKRGVYLSVLSTIPLNFSIINKEKRLNNRKQSYKKEKKWQNICQIKKKLYLCIRLADKASEKTER